VNWSGGLQAQGFLWSLATHRGWMLMERHTSHHLGTKRRSLFLLGGALAKCFGAFTRTARIEATLKSTSINKNKNCKPVSLTQQLSQLQFSTLQKYLSQYKTRRYEGLYARLCASTS